MYENWSSDVQLTVDIKTTKRYLSLQNVQCSNNNNNDSIKFSRDGEHIKVQDRPFDFTFIFHYFHCQPEPVPKCRFLVFIQQICSCWLCFVFFCFPWSSVFYVASSANLSGDACYSTYIMAMFHDNVDIYCLSAHEIKMIVNWCSSFAIWFDIIHVYDIWTLNIPFACIPISHI